MMQSAYKEGTVSGFLHEPDTKTGAGLVMTHGASGNAKAAFLEIVAESFCGVGWWVLRCDMAYRQRRPSGPPNPAGSAQDRESLRDAVAVMSKLTAGPVVLGGHSYGGRQASMLVSEEPALVAGLLLCSYPLHPPGKPEQLRTAHLSSIRTPALFVHGTKDAFGSIEELSRAIQLIPARTHLSVVEGGGHDLKRGKFDVDELLVKPLRTLVAAEAEHHTNS